MPAPYCRQPTRQTGKDKMKTGWKRAAMLLGLAASFGITSAGAEDYPTKPVKLIVGFAPGGTVDVVARIVGESLSRKLGKPFIVENRTGANGMIAATALAQSD